MKQTKITITLLLVLTIVTGTAFAWGQGFGRRGCQGGGQIEECARNGGAWANLSQEQQDQLTGLRQKFIDETYAIRSEKRSIHAEIRDLMETSSPDREALGQLSQQMLDLNKQLMDKRIEFQLEAKKIAPELSFGKGFGKGRKNRSNCRGQYGYQDQPGETL